MLNFWDWSVRTGVAGLLAIIAMSLPLLLAGCTWLGEVTQSDQAKKIRAFWCGERIPAYAALLEAFAPDAVDLGVEIAVAAAAAICRDETAPIDVLVAKGVSAGQAVAAASK